MKESTGQCVSRTHGPTRGPTECVLPNYNASDCIREVRGLNVALDTDYPDSGVSWFCSVPPDECRDSISDYTTVASFHTISNLLFVNYSTFRRPMFWVTGNVINRRHTKNKKRTWDLKPGTWLYWDTLFPCHINMFGNLEETDPLLVYPKVGEIKMTD